jgi:multidrug efflux pump subunit AcrB
MLTSQFINRLTELDLQPILLTMLTLHCAIGVIAAIVAQHKGRNFKQWLIWGLIGGTPTLLVAIFRSDSPLPPAK